MFYPSFSSQHYFKRSILVPFRPSQLPAPSEALPATSEALGTIFDALQTPSKAPLAPCDQRPSQLLPIQGLPSSHQSPPAPSDPKPSQLPPCPSHLPQGFLITLLALPAPSEAFVALVEIWTDKWTDRLSYRDAGIYLLSLLYTSSGIYKLKKCRPF